MTRTKANLLYRDILKRAEETNTLPATLRHLSKTDLFFLLVYICKRVDVDRDFLYDRCRELQSHPNGYVDLWARFHYKSTIGTFGLTIQEILNNPDITICILSFNRPTAKMFLSQIKREFENNNLLKQLFPDIIWSNTNQAPAWSLDTGLILKRKANPAVSTVEAFGLVDGQPIGRHYNLLIYDDVVTKDSVTNPDMIRKTTEAWELSQALTTEGGKTRYYGTRYHFNDTYKTMIDRKAVKSRIYPATENGQADGKTVLLDKDELANHRRTMGLYTFSCQMLQNPKADDTRGFKAEWIRRWEGSNYKHLNVYILVDPANQKKKNSDYTAMMVVGIGADNNYYIIDIVRDKLNLTERTETLIELHREYRPVAVFYERYGIQGDIDHIRYVQEQYNYRFDIKEVNSPQSKNDRIEKLVPLFEQGRLYLPNVIKKKDYQGHIHNLCDDFVKDEYLAYPVGAHDDMLDCLAWMMDDKVGMKSPIKSRMIIPKKAKTQYSVFNA